MDQNNYERQVIRIDPCTNHMKLYIEPTQTCNIIRAIFKTHKMSCSGIFAYVFISKYPYFPNSQPMVMSSYCTIYATSTTSFFLHLLISLFKRNENDITKNINNHQKKNQCPRKNMRNKPYLPFLQNTKAFILWMRRINVIGYQTQICFCTQFYTTICYDNALSKNLIPTRGCVICNECRMFTLSIFALFKYSYSYFWLGYTSSVEISEEESKCVIFIIIIQGVL